MSVGFIPNITLPTRISKTAATLIDNIFTNNFEKSHISGVLMYNYTFLGLPNDIHYFENKLQR